MAADKVLEEFGLFWRDGRLAYCAEWKYCVLAMAPTVRVPQKPKQASKYWRFIAI
jgi:hypothetical protein